MPYRATLQELCRVLFDCLEEAFKGTDNATLIDDLYQGEMVSYSVGRFLGCRVECCRDCRVQ